MFRSTRACLLLLIALLSGSSLAIAASTTLTSLVPADAGLCLVANDLAPHADRVLAGPLKSRWQAFPPWVQWSATNRPALEQLSAEVGRQLGVAPKDVWREIFGHRAVLAAWPKTDAAQVDGPGLLLVEARDSALLLRLIDGLCEAQLRAGEVVDTRDVTHAGVDYRDRTIRRGGVDSHVYLAVLGPIGVLSSDESLLKRVLDLHAVPPQSRRGLAELPLYRQALEQVDASAPLTLFVNSRRWDETVAAGQSEGEESDKSGSRAIVDLWRSSRHWSFSLRLAPRPTLLASVQFDPLAETDPLGQTLASVAGPASFAQRVPANCLAAAAGSFEIGRMVQLWRGAAVAAGPRSSTGPTLPVAPGQRRGMAGVLNIVWNLLDDIFQGLGPSLGGYIAASDEPDREIPADIVAGIGIQSRLAKATSKPSYDLAAGLRSLVEFAVALDDRPANEPGPRVRTTDDGSNISEITGLSGLPPGWQPTFAVTQGLLLAGTSRRALEVCAKLSAEDSLAARLAKSAILSPGVNDPSHLVYFNLAATRGWLAAHRGTLAALVAAANKAEPAQIDRGLNQLQVVLSLADSLVLAAKVRTTGVAVCIVLVADDNEGSPPHAR